MLSRRWKINLRETGEIFWEKTLGYDYSTFVEPKSSGLDPARSYPYMKSDKRFLLNVFGKLTITDSDRVLDVGAGKGYGIWLLSFFPFAKVDGVEISPKLAEIARRNLKRANISSTVYVGDATCFERMDDYTFFYLFNPFPRLETERFFHNFSESLKRKPRKVTVAYLNPENGDLFEKTATRSEVYDGTVGHIATKFAVYYFDEVESRNL